MKPPLYAVKFRPPLKLAQVEPPSVERKIAHPAAPLAYAAAAYRMLGFTGSIFTVDIWSVHCESNRGVQLAPPVVLLHTPPLGDATNIVPLAVGCSAIASIRPASTCGPESQYPTPKHPRGPIGSQPPLERPANPENGASPARGAIWVRTRAMDSQSTSRLGYARGSSNQACRRRRNSAPSCASCACTMVNGATPSAPASTQRARRFCADRFTGGLPAWRWRG